MQMEFGLIKNIFTLVGIPIPKDISRKKDNDFEVVCNKVKAYFSNRMQGDVARKMDAEHFGNFASAAYIQEGIDDLERYKELIDKMLSVKQQLMKR